MNSALDKISKGLYAYGNLFVLRKEPTIVYAPGHVGSMAMLKNLRDSGVYSFKVETFAIESRLATKFCKKYILDTNQPARIITLVRDPVELMASYFFSKASGSNQLLVGATALAEKDVQKLLTSFVDEVLRTARLDKHLFWYEYEFAPQLGFSVFDHPFYPENKWAVINHKRFPTLILRIDLNDKDKGRVVGDFLDNSTIKITRENTSDTRPTAKLYKEFKEYISLPEDVLEKIYNAPYSRHFFSREEREALKEKWS